MSRGVGHLFLSNQLYLTALDYSGNTNCITQALDNIQATYGPIDTNVTDLVNLVGKFDASSFLPNITCTNCNKAIYNELNQSGVSLVNDLGTALESQCGASFISKALSNAYIKIQRTDFLGS